MTVKPIVHILTGTPVLNNSMDLFQQWLVMDGGATFGKNYFIFRGKFFVDRNAYMPKHIHFPKWEPRTLERDGFDGIAEINKLIQPFSMRVMKKDCMDLPPLVRQVIKCGMTREQERMYGEMRDDFITYLEKPEEVVVATLAITKALRLQQIASGFCKTVSGEEIALTDTPKMEALRELLEEITPHAKVLVWAVFKENYRQIRKVCDDIGVKYVEVTGDVPSSERSASVERFNSDDETRVYLGHPGSGGIGVNLVRASYSIFYSRNFSLENDLQAEARNYRGGSEIHAKITRYDLVCEGTIDEIVADSLANKIQIGEKTLRALKDFLRTGKPLLEQEERVDA